MTVLDKARQLTESGFSVIPIKSDGSKAPAVAWKPYQKRIATPGELKRWSCNGYGIGIVAGKVSGNLEVIDFDDPAAFERWKKLVEELGGVDLLKMLVIVETPTGGFHVYYRCSDGVEGNQKLAQRKDSNGKLKTLIETRGEGGYVIAPGSPKTCHPLKKCYKRINGQLTEIPTIAGEERELLLNAARALSEYIKPKRLISGNSDASGNRPGDDFNTRAQWAEILEPHGWQKVRETGEVTHWRRPDKKQGISATTNIGGSNLLYVFSTNGDPFEAQTAYSPFAAYTLLNHNRDFSAAAADLANKGYGEKPKQHHSTPYRTTPSGLEWLKPTSNGPVPVSLTNFTAEISADISRDDGLEVQHFFEIEAQAKGQTFRFTVPATQFQGMQWVTEHLGAQAVVYAGYGAKDHARVAIQLLSENISHRRVFTHTGWKRIDESWVYLHAGGAIGPDGTVNGVEVQLEGVLSNFHLPDPPKDDELAKAVQASLRLTEVAPYQITIPLLAGVFRSTIGGVDFSEHLAGPTGAGKSELAALCQQHFGPQMNRLHLPGNWSSTANSLEGLAFSAKDTLFVIDDFAPTGTMYDISRMHREADRILRAQGNNSARQRMRSDTTLRPPKPPRGLILSTGEDIPRGQSLRARVWVVELSPGDINWNLLTECQKHATHGLYSQAMAGFVLWLALHYESVQQNLPQEIQDLRERAFSSGMHKRTPEIVANLAYGWSLFLEFSKDVGAISEDERQDFWERGWNALGQAAASQQHHQAASEPTQRFLEVVRAAIASGQAHVAGPEGDAPKDARRWGWVEPREEYDSWRFLGRRIGWIDGEDLYLEPNASYAAAQRMSRDSGESLAISSQTLRKRLKEKKLLKSIDEKRSRLTVRKSLEGARREVLHLHADSLMPGESSQVSQSAPSDSQTPIDRDGPGDSSWDENGALEEKPSQRNGPQPSPNSEVKDTDGTDGTIGTLSEDKPGNCEDLEIVYEDR